jgi:hypothetical protein
MSARHRDRERKPARREPFREQKPIILVVCEGEVTEKEYLVGIEKKYRNSRVTIEIAPESGRDPLSLVKVAKDRKREAEEKAKKQGDDNLAYDQVWCLHDIDDHTDKIPRAKVMARDNGIQLAASNPCIELWLYLHFKDTGLIHRDNLAKLLKKHIPQYDKHVNFANYEAGLADAIQRGKALDKLAKAAGEPDRNPTTGIYRLVEEIQKT